MRTQITWICLFLLPVAPVLVRSLPIIRPELPPGKHCCPVSPSLLWSKEVRGLSPSAENRVSSFLDYRFLLPELQLRDGLEHLGSAVRLRRFVSDLMAGSRPLKVGVVGGSISWGEGATSRDRTGWFSVFMSWLASVGPSKVSGRNGCVPATTSNYLLLCLNHLVDPDVDLVLVECSIKDGFSDKLTLNSAVDSHEKLIRRLLDLSGRPAVVLVQLPYLRSTSFNPFPITSEDVEGALAAFYDLPSVSLRNALYSRNVYEPTEGLLWNQTFANMHPGDAGHKAITDLVVHLIQETALRLVHYPVSEPERRQQKEPLPPPMYEGNSAPPTPSCVVGPELRDLVISAEGWHWTNEGSGAQPKWGFVTSVPGSELRLQLSTRDPRAEEGNAKAVGTVAVLLHYYKSYQNLMGSVLLSCLGGCSCTSQALDGWHEEQQSQTSMTHIKTYRLGNATTCDLSIVVLEQTSSRGHKFKVSGVVVGVGYDLTGTYEHKFWRIPDDT